MYKSTYLDPSPHTLQRVLLYCTDHLTLLLIINIIIINGPYSSPAIRHEQPARRITALPTISLATASEQLSAVMWLTFHEFRDRHDREHYSQAAAGKKSARIIVCERLDEQT